mgnify:CR=1 FL=1
MAYRQVSFAVGEYFHCYTRGIDKRVTFQDEQDYARFIQCLYVCNDVRPFRRDALISHVHTSLLRIERHPPLVAILASRLMPTRKLGTAYTMYFNAKNERIGGLFVRPFRAKHIDDDAYIKQVIQYVHLNPAELYEPEWKKGVIKNMRSLKQNLGTYPYSSFQDFNGAQRAERSILDQMTIQSLYDNIPSLSESIEGAADYYAHLRW